MKTSREFEAGILRNLQQDTGRSLDTWMNIIHDSTYQERENIVNYVMDQYKISFRQATVLATVYLNNRKPRYQIFILLAVIFIGISCSSTDQPQDQSSNQDFPSIVYNVFHNTETDDYEVFGMTWDADSLWNISSSPGVDWSYHLIGDRILYVSDRDTTHRIYFLYETDKYGSFHRKISDVRLADSWMSSRDNGEIIVRPYGDSGFYIIDSLGNIIQHINTKLPYMSDPEFSPDGRYIVFRGGRKTSKREEGFNEELYIINANGSGLRQLTNYPESDSTAPWYAYHAGPPLWRNSGITFSSFRNGNYSIYQISPSGDSLLQVTDNLNNQVYHDVSANGKWMVYSYSDLQEKVYDLELLNMETGEKRQLTDDTIQQLAPLFLQ